ncbi:MAG: EAL domain-containing protein, partial [Acidobacteriaceae bacterium]
DRVRGGCDDHCNVARNTIVKSTDESRAHPRTSTAASVAGREGLSPAFQESDCQYRLLFESNPIPMWVFDRQTLHFLAVNPAAMRQYGYSEAQFLRMTIADIRPAETVPDLMLDVARRRPGLQEPELWKHCRKDGTIIDVEVVCHDLEFQQSKAMLVAAYDVTARERAQEAARQAEEKYRAIFDYAVVGIFQHTPDGRPVNVNQAFAQMHGYDSPEALLAEVTNAATQLFVEPQRMLEAAEAAATQGIVRGAEVELYRKDRSRFWVMVNLRAVRDPAGKIVLFEGTAEDITNRKAAEAQVNFLAYHDALTGLPNRALFMDRLECALAGARRRSEKLAVLFLDLDRFKNINDSLGHSIGDRLLKVVAERLKDSLREQDTVARVGGDEFLIMLSGADHAAEPALAARRLMNAMARPFFVEGHMLSTSSSIGVSIFPDHGEDGETLIKNADAAMYCAKDDGSNRVRVFADRMNRAAVAQLTLENDLRTALEAKEFFLVFQPQMELATGTITGIEALLRWQHPVLGLVPPDRFIPVAENTGLILPIGDWVLRTAGAQIVEWQRQGLALAPVSVNVSALQFRQEGFCASIRRVLRETGLPASSLELELTESVLLSNADVMRPVLQELKDMGVALAIDDFGTGYSSLSYLKQFRFAKLKIDRSFIREVATSSDDAAITTAIIRMAKSLNMRVVAEGVENPAQMAFLRERGCDEIQGYYFSRPVAADDMGALLGSVRANGRLLQANSDVPASA